jgi:hypothetical protein
LRPSLRRTPEHGMPRPFRSKQRTCEGNSRNIAEENERLFHPTCMTPPPIQWTPFPSLPSSDRTMSARVAPPNIAFPSLSHLPSYLFAIKGHPLGVLDENLQEPRGSDPEPRAYVYSGLVYHSGPISRPSGGVEREVAFRFVCLRVPSTLLH